MARYRLKEPHYLNVPGTEWEQQETPLGTNAKAIRKRYPVPRFLHPGDASDHNYPDEIIVSTKFDKKYPNDIIFAGLPTPDMEPLDEEAEEVFARLKPVWDRQHPIESLSGSYGDALAERFEREADQAARSNPAMQEINSLKEVVASQQKMIEQLMAKLDERPARRA